MERSTQTARPRISAAMAEAHPGEVALRILVVDDEENIRVTLAMCLEADGHTAVTCAGSRGQAA